MPLVLANQITTIDEGTNLLIVDSTQFDDPYSREYYYVNFTVLDMRNNPPADITPPYDQATVSEILVPISHDGWYKVTMAYTANPDANPPYVITPDELVKDYLSSELFCICKSKFAYKVFSCFCNCNPQKVQELYCLNAQLSGVLDLVAQNDMLNADQAIERMNLECALYNEDCKCH